MSSYVFQRLIFSSAVNTFPVRQATYPEPILDSPCPWPVSPLHCQL